MSEERKLKASLIGLDNLIEDLFGLNAKAFKSIWKSFSTPKTYAIAATDSKWSETFTPTVRVWVGLVAFYSALRFFYGSEDGGMTQMYVEMFEAEIAKNPGSSFAEVDTTLLAQSVLKWTFVFFPLIMLPLYGCLAFIFRVWPDKPSFVVRFRYIMLTVLPGTTFTALLTITYVFLQGAMLALIMVISLAGILLFDGLTAYRGTLHSVKSGKLCLSIVLSILLVIAFSIGSFAAAIPAGMAAMMEVAP